MSASLSRVSPQTQQVSNLDNFQTLISRMAKNVSSFAIPLVAIITLIGLPGADAGPLTYAACVTACTAVAPPAFPACVTGCLVSLFAPGP